MARRAELAAQSEDVAELRARIAHLEGRSTPDTGGGWEALVREKQRQAAAEMAAEARARQDPAVRAGLKPLPPVSARKRISRRDPTEVRNSKGEIVAPPDGHSFHWVPEITQNLDKGNQFINRYQNQGYKPFENPETPGEPFRWGENILMIISDEEKAELVMEMSPTQGVNPKDYFAAQAMAALGGYEEMAVSTKIKAKISGDMEYSDRADA